MFEKHLIEQAAPTLAGLKPASLFPYCADTRRHALGEIREWDKKLSASGIRIRVLCSCEKRSRALVYVYRPSEVAALLTEQANADFLSEMGYDTSAGPQDLLRQLVRRIKAGTGMPHEIGVFLGYPLEDVEGFIKNHGKKQSFCGYWKAYGDPVEARRRFTQLKSCCTAYRELYSRGYTVMELAVPA